MDYFARNAEARALRDRDFEFRAFAAGCDAYADLEIEGFIGHHEMLLLYNRWVRDGRMSE